MCNPVTIKSFSFEYDDKLVYGICKLINQVQDMIWEFQKIAHLYLLLYIAQRDDLLSINIYCLAEGGYLYILYG